MKVIGITGGVGSGKSAVLKLLEEEYHAVVVQLDEVAKALQRKGTPCWKAIVEAFGREILDENEELDRKKLAQIVFQSSEKLEQLNGIVHPQYYPTFSEIPVCPLRSFQTYLHQNTHLRFPCSEIPHIF